MGDLAGAKSAIANSRSQVVKCSYLLFPFDGSRMGIHWLKWPLVTYTRGEDFYATFRKSDQFDTIVIPFDR